MTPQKIGLFALLCLAGCCEVCLPTSAKAEPSPALPKDFLATLQSIKTAYANKDIKGILRHYASDCTFLLIIPAFLLDPDAEEGKIKARRERHTLAWQRQQLQHLFFPPSQPLGNPLAPSGQPASPPVQRITLTSHIEKSLLARQATEIRLTVRRTVTGHQGHITSRRSEVDTELWRKGRQGWKLKRRRILSQGMETIVSG